MRLTALIPTLFAIGAFILSMLVLFAGHKPGFMEDAALLTLNVSQLGHLQLNSSSEHPTASKIFNLLPSGLQSEINNVTNDIASDVAKEIGIHDFYSAHVLDYCEGYYTPTSHPNASTATHKNVTKCSNQTAGFAFDPEMILQNELPGNITLADLNWPQDVTNGIRALRTLFKAMFIIYCIGIAAAGVSILTGLINIFVGGRALVTVNFLLAIVAFLALGIASAIATAAAVKAGHLVNKYGSEIGIAAYRGNKFLGMTWAATVLMLLAACLWVFECCIGGGRRERRRGGGKAVY
ncbi:MAG: hypothetical protein M1824_005004 [Vezdaea acicularis]|nr:MAG: hypothetical protein M1824_005004 [Vezdaea acicularis]